MSYKTIIKRNESASNIMKYPKIEENDRLRLGGLLMTQTVLNTANKCLMIGVLWFMYKRKFFDGPSRFMAREMLTVAGFVGYNYGFEYLNNEFFWKRAQGVVLKYARMKERDFFDLAQSAPRQSEHNNDQLYD